MRLAALEHPAEDDLDPVPDHVGADRDPAQDLDPDHVNDRLPDPDRAPENDHEVPLRDVIHAVRRASGIDPPPDPAPVPVRARLTPSCPLTTGWLLSRLLPT